MDNANSIPSYAVLFLTTVLVTTSGTWDTLHHRNKHVSGLSSSSEESRPQHHTPRPAPPGFPWSPRVTALSAAKPMSSRQAGLLAPDATSSPSPAHPARVFLLPELLLPVPIPGFHFVPFLRPTRNFVEKSEGTSYFSQPAQVDVVSRQDNNVYELGYSASEDNEGGNESFTGPAFSSLKPSSVSSPFPSHSSIESSLNSSPFLSPLVRSSLSSSGPTSPSSSSGFPPLPEDIEPRVNPIAFPSPDDPKIYETLSKDRIIFPSTTEKTINFPSQSSPPPSPTSTSPPFPNATVVANVHVVSENNTDIRVSIIAPHRPCTRLCQYPAGSGVCLTDFTCIRNVNFLRVRPQPVKKD
ncbi:rho GTPase-activating protein gacJ-like [Penaeus monodon]|uniref:rho GTPase-activating protein gacJ-like n=1 Tax=Penaeus monodon TaxID=6687 RepID=UPI0018A6DECB|nr:rho GTPase-activating protein gacJ-like [Penaeus monodon]XP_037795589.1 rho GTPase-activating protein gacJ-like [Penaeus monodon]